MTNTDESLSPEQEGMAKVGTMLAMVVEDALRPALLPFRLQQEGPGETNHDGYVMACKHVSLGLGTRFGRNDPPVAVDRNAYLCPMHPDQLLCDADGCVEDHRWSEHRYEQIPPLCFQCEQPVEEDFVPVFAEITLHQNVNLGFEDQAGACCVLRAYGGVLLTLPAAYLCSLHAGLVQVPLRMGWPMGNE